MLPLRKEKEYAAFDMYKLIAQWTTKVDMTNMYKIRKEFSNDYYLMVASAIYLDSNKTKLYNYHFHKSKLLLNFLASICQLLVNLTMTVSNLFKCDHLHNVLPSNLTHIQVLPHTQRKIKVK